MKRYLYYTALSACILAALLLFACGALAGENAAAAMEALKDPAGPTLGISHRGDWHAAPENSEEAIVAAVNAGLRLVAADVSLTKDGVPVLCEANSAKRMLGTSTDAVADYTLSELQALPLKDKNGGKNNRATGARILTLEGFLALAQEHDFAAVPMVDASFAETAVKTVADKNAAGYTAFLFTGNAKNVKSAIGTYGGDYCVLGEKRGNVIFDVLGFTDHLKENGAAGAILKTTNRYGVIYYPSVLRHISGSLRAVANTAESRTCGAREDTVKWWDDLISRGYSVIITDDPVCFAAYEKDAAAARSRLQTLYTQATGEWQPPAFRDNALNDYKKAYTDALADAEALLEDQSASLQDLRDAYTALTVAMDEIDLNYEALETGAAGKAITLPRILLCIGAAAVVFIVQVYFYKKRKKA